MGYTTNFNGKLKFNKKLSLKHFNILNDYAEKDWRDDSSRPYEYSYYCQWVPTEDGSGLEWNGAEKFYGYIEWLEWLIKNFFEPKGYRLTGDIEWEGEEKGDLGKISVVGNKIKVKKGKITYK